LLFIASFALSLLHSANNSIKSKRKKNEVCSSHFLEHRPTITKCAKLSNDADSTAESHQQQQWLDADSTAESHQHQQQQWLD